MVWKNFYKSIACDISRLYRGKQNLANHQHLLNPGVWLLDVRCSWRLSGEKSYIQTKNAISPPIIPTKKKIYNIFYRLVGASLYIKANKSAQHDYKFDLVFFSRCNTIKFFDFKNMWVLTYYPTSFSTTSALKKEFDSYFKIFKTIEEEKITINGIEYKKERFLTSPILAIHPEKLKYANEIFINYKKYLNITTGKNQPGLFLYCITYIGNKISDPDFDAFINRHSIQLASIDRGLLYYPSHGDFNAENIIIHNDEIFIIDLDEFGTLLPGFFDLMYLCRSFELKEAYKNLDFIDIFNSCVSESFENYNPDFNYLHLILWVFYNSPYYRDAVNLSDLNKDTLVKSWIKFKQMRLPNIDAALTIAS